MSVIKGRCSPSSHQQLKLPHVYPEGIQIGEKKTGNRILALDSKGAYQKNDFREHRLLQPSHALKNAKFINPRCLVFL